jgi:hypothetical protein
MSGAEVSGKSAEVFLEARWYGFFIKKTSYKHRA